MLPRLIDIQISQQRFDSLVLYWRPIGTTLDVAGTTVAILRSYVQADGYVEIASVAANSMVYVDEEANAQSNWLSVYYKIVVTNSDGSNTYGPLNVTDETHPVDRNIIRRVALFLRNNGAVPCLIYQPSYGSETDRCPKCWDAELQHLIYSNCDVCAGTSYVGTLLGYYNPILTLVDIQPPGASKQVEDVAHAELITQCRMSNFPALRPGDIIRELNTGVMWLVAGVTRQVRAKVLLSQDPVRLRQIKPADIEHTLPVPASITPVLRRHRAVRERILRDIPGADPVFVEVVV